MIEKARSLLYEQYNSNRMLISDKDKHNLYFVDEKVVHSQQVLGAGNYIIKHEAFFQNKSADFIKQAKVAALLHDIARFKEGLHRSKTHNLPFNHAFEGAEILKNISDFNSPEIVLPVKYHSTRYIQPLYDDECFIKLNPVQQENVEAITKMVRDADKIANFNLIVNDCKHMEKLTFVDVSKNIADQQPPNEKILSSFMNEELVLNDCIISKSDRILSFIAWIFDLNYVYSFDFCYKLNLFQKLLSYFNSYCEDEKIQELIANKIYSFINNIYKIKK